ncbi:MAG: hypothetical protein V3S01_03370 [Dehalococcoidia bacterium]
MPAPIDPETWLRTLQDLLRYYLPPPSPSPLTKFGGLAAVAAGVFLVCRSWKFERFVVSCFGLLVGAWVGYWISLLLGTSAPIPAAVGAVAMTALAYQTYRWWLAFGSVTILFGTAVVFQLGRGDLQRYLPHPNEGSRMIGADIIEGLPSRLEQDRNLHPSWSDQIARMKEPVKEELKALGPIGWLLPVAAAILGGLLAYWALRAFAVMWLGLLGAIMVSLGTATFLCAHWPNVRTWLISEPLYPAGFTIGLWLLGLILQAKEARIPTKRISPGAGAKNPPKS